MRHLQTESRPGTVSLPVQRVKGANVSLAADWVAEEVPVALEVNGISQAVMLATPLDLADFALGFSITEGLIEGPHQLYDIEELPGPLGITLKLEIAAAAFARLKLRRRSMAGRTGCGLCGTESLGQVARALPVFKGAARFTPVAVAQAMAAMADRQALQQLTGAVHAAAWCNADGSVCLVREDIGRHNALDKLVGALAAAGIDASPGFVAVTSRASFEMVQKAAMAGVGLLAAVSAPTAMAVATANEAGLTLVRFARQQGAVVYTHAQRFTPLTEDEPVHAS
jgi:FdhD protein